MLSAAALSEGTGHYEGATKHELYLNSNTRSEIFLCEDDYERCSRRARAIGCRCTSRSDWGSETKVVFSAQRLERLLEVSQSAGPKLKTRSLRVMMRTDDQTERRNGEGRGGVLERGSDVAAADLQGFSHQNHLQGLRRIATKREKHAVCCRSAQHKASRSQKEEKEKQMGERRKATMSQTTSGHSRGGQSDVPEPRHLRPRGTAAATGSQPLPEPWIRNFFVNIQILKFRLQRRAPKINLNTKAELITLLFLLFAFTFA